MNPPVIKSNTTDRQILPSAKKIIALVFLCNVFQASLSAQTHSCGVHAPTSDQLEYFYQASVKAMSSRSDGRIKYISIKPFVVRENNGTGGATISDLNQTLVNLNNTFKDLNVEFHFCKSGFSYIDNSKFVDFDSREEGELTQGNEVNHSINIYFVNSISINGFGASGGYTYYPGSETHTNRIFTINTATKKGNFLLAHELGHYFGLYHTFDRNGGMELVTRGENGNCSYAGDHVCDTEADPFSMDGATFEGCNYTGTVRDLNGDLYTPPVDNIMSYYNNCAQKFTPGQFERMSIGASIRTSQSAYNLLSGISISVSPPDNLSYTKVGTFIYLKWRDNSNNETGFIVERSTSPDDGYEQIAGLGPNTTSFVDQTISPGISYYYRVKASNLPTLTSNAVLHCVPVAEHEGIIGATEVCDGSYEYAIASSEGVNYEWKVSGGGSLISEKNKATINWTKPGIHTIMVTPTNPCSTGTSKTLTVVVNSTSTVSLNEIFGPEEVCVGEYNYDVANMEGFTYQWGISGGGTITADANGAVVKWDEPGYHTLWLTPSNSCGEGKKITKLIKVFEDAGSEGIGPIQFKGTSVCPGVHHYSVKHISDVNYEWMVEGEYISMTSTGATADIEWGTPGLYTIKVVPTNVCGNSQAQTLQVKVVETPEKPVISIVKGKLASNLEGEHQWYLNEEPISGARGAVCPSTLAGSYSVQQISACGQGPLSEVYVLEKSLASNDIDGQFIIYPNPASNHLSLELPTETEWSNIILVASTGETIIVLEGSEFNETTIRGNNFKQLITLDVQNYARGLYLLKVQTREGTLSKRIIFR